MSKHAVLLFAAMAFALAFASAGAHDVSEQFKVCYSTPHASAEAKAPCLADELRRQDQALEQMDRARAASLGSTQQRRFADEAAEWRKKTLLECSILADDKTVPLERENVRKYCLIDRSVRRLNSAN